MRFAKISVTTIVGGAALAVGIASPAMADDATLWSTTGHSYAWYDDSTDQVSICDMVANDGGGANGTVQLPSGPSDRTVYNGCETWRGIPDGVRMRITVCDWLPSGNGYRNPYNCRTTWLTS